MNIDTLLDDEKNANNPEIEIFINNLYEVQEFGKSNNKELYINIEFGKREVFGEKSECSAIMNKNKNDDFDTIILMTVFVPENMRNKKIFTNI